MSSRVASLPFVALVAAVLAGASCVLPSYRQGSGGAGTTSSGSTTGSSSSSSSTGAGGAPACPPGPFTLQLGGADRVRPSALAWLTDGGAVVGGQFFTKLDWKPPSSLQVSEMMHGDGFFVGVDTTGHGKWALALSGPDQENITSVLPSPDGSVIVGGWVNKLGFTLGSFGSQLDTPNGSDAFVAKISPDGQVVWLDELGATVDGGGNGLFRTKLTVDPLDGSIYLAGAANSGITIRRQPAVGTDVVVDDKAGRSPFFAHFNENGEVVSAQTWSAGYGVGSEVVLGPAGEHFYLGSYGGNPPDFGFANPLPPTGNGNDGFIISLDAQDVPQWGGAFGSAERDDLPIDATYVGNQLVMVVESHPIGSMPDNANFSIGGDSTILSIGKRTSLVVAGLSSIQENGLTASWLRSITMPDQNQIDYASVGARGAEAVVSLSLPKGNTDLMNMGLMSMGTDSVLLTFAADKGTITGYFDLTDGSPKRHQGHYAPTACGDGLFVNLEGEQMLAGKSFNTSTENAIVVFGMNALPFMPANL